MNGIQALWDHVYASSARLLPVYSRTTLLLAAPAPLPAQAEGLRHPRPRAVRATDSPEPALTGPWPAQCSIVLPELRAQLCSSESQSVGKVGLPGWITPLFINLAVLIGIAAWVHGWSSAPAAKASTRPLVSAQKPSPAPLPASVQSADPPYPFASFIEVTGLRVVVDLNHRSQVQYLVVNHSAIPLTGLNLQVAVRSALAASGSEPLFTVAVRIPSLGAHQSKEIRTDLDSQLREAAIPDWDNLRAEVQVTAQP